MKTKLLFSLLITFFNLQLYSQDYEPILKEGSFWDIKTVVPVNSCSSPNIQNLKRIQVDGDTIINNMSYKKLKKVIIDGNLGTNSCLYPPFIVQTAKLISVENTYLRENTDEKRLYILTNYITNKELKEYTICDFSLSIGDTLENYLGFDSSDTALIVDDIKTDKEGKKVFYMNDGSYYTEGIGRNEGNLNIYFNLVDESYERLHCFGNAQNQNECATVIDNSTYAPVIKEGSFWDYLYDESCASAGCIPPRGKRYKISGDTIVNNISYKKIKKASIRSSNDHYYLINSSDQWYINNNEFVDAGFLLRENIREKKVYIFDTRHNINNEKTLYDFNLNVGDIMENPYSPHEQGIKVQITSISISAYNGKPLFVSDPYGSFIEGIGNDFSFYSIPALKSIYNSGNIICHGNDETSNKCTAVLRTDNYDLSPVKIFPNPVKDILTIQNTENITVKIYSINGSLLKTKTSNTNFEIDVSSFSSGIYFLEASNFVGKHRRKFIKI